MSVQKILLISLVFTVAVTLGLYILKAVKQVRYKGDERWTMIQLKASTVADLSNWGLVVILFILQLTADMTATITISRLVTYGLMFFGIHNTLELVGVLIYDKMM